MKILFFLFILIISSVNNGNAQTYYINSTTDVSFSNRFLLHNNVLKIGNSSSSAEREKNVIKIGDGSYIQIGEWEADNYLSFKAKRFNFIPSSGGLNVMNNNVGSAISLSDGYGNIAGKPRLVLHQRMDIPHAYIYFNQNLYFISDGANGVTPLVLQYDGTVGIGFPQGFSSGINHTNGYKLAVNGNIHAKSIDVDMYNWSDFVFGDNYKLRTLHELENFIKTNGHLPEMPSEKEVLLNGINLGEIQSKLLQKIEELTLYLIEMEKQNFQLQRRVYLLEKELKLK